LLEDVLRRQRKGVVPLSLVLDSATRTLLISGPNAGGKTVALKTVGLLVLMAQSGLPVPCEAIELPVFEQVLADIGDNQSIEQSLSTFSAHVARIREMVESVGVDSLVLLDELGRATDPEEGGALGVAIVDRMRRTGAFTLASTHLLAPKIYGAATEGVLNASMSFDERTLEPTFHMRVGAPGASAGLDIAQRLGLPAALIEQARATLRGAQRQAGEFLKLLERKLEAAATLERELREEKARLENERRSELLFEQFEARARETIEKIELDAEQRKLAARSQRQVARTRREMREEFEATVIATRNEARQGEIERPKLREGVRVRLKDVREPGRVRRILANGIIEVEAGFLKLKIGEDEVIEVLPDAPEPARLPRNVQLRTARPETAFTSEINLIGQRVEEARDAVDKFLDDAVLASVLRVRIVHGHGMGILKKAIGELLKGHPHVEKHYEARPEEGGAGATIVELRAY
jgi:DNA mismatch repair protein MutS2